MTGLRAIPFGEDLLEATVPLFAGGLRGIAGRVDARLLRLPEAPAEKLAETALRGYLAAEPAAAGGRSGWAVLDGDLVRAFTGTLTTVLTPDDPRYTFMPPASVTMTSTGTHAGSEAAAGDGYPLLLAAVAAHADRLGGARVFVHVPVGDTAARTVWRRLGLELETVSAWRPVAGWQPPGTPPSGVTVRVARPDDVAALTDLALEQRRFHIAHTNVGLSPDQPPETYRRIAAEAVAAPADRSRQLVAEDAAGRVVGSIVGTVQQFGDDQLQRYLFPSRCGYLGLTSVTAAARGRGVGRALLDALMGWFAERRVDAVFLHYVVDNELSARFWARAGFVPHIEVYAR